MTILVLLVEVQDSANTATEQDIMSMVRMTVAVYAVEQEDIKEIDYLDPFDKRDEW